MLLDLTELVDKYGLQIGGVLHLGAHLAEEAETYEKLGIRKVIWVEGNGDNIPLIHKAVDPYGHYVIEALISDTQGEALFHITNYDSMSSSLLDFGTHTKFSPDTVFVEHRVLETTTVDALRSLHHGSVFSGVNMMNLDLQGAELLALKGARRMLREIDYIYTEVNQDEVYKDCAQVNELDDYLREWHFYRVETGWVPRQGWGDALYIKRAE